MREAGQRVHAPSGNSDLLIPATLTGLDRHQDRAVYAAHDVGTDLASKIMEICQTAHLELLDATEARTPSTLVELSSLPGLGPQRIQRLHTELGVRSVADLRAVIAVGALRKLPGFGVALEHRLAAALSMTPPQRWPRAIAEPQAKALAAALRRLPGVEAVRVAGSIRRSQSDAGDIDLVAAAVPGAGVTRAFMGLPQVAGVLACGRARATVRLASGLQADLLVVGPESFGAAMVHFTGSKAHNIALRQRARTRGLKLNEYGLYSGRERIAGRTEAEVYAGLGLPESPPAGREGCGEIGEVPVYGARTAAPTMEPCRKSSRAALAWTNR